MPHIQTELDKDDFYSLKMAALNSNTTIKKLIHDAVVLYINNKLYALGNDAMEQLKTRKTKEGDLKNGS